MGPRGPHGAPPPPHRRWGWHGGYGCGPGCGGCLFSFLLIFGLGITGIAGLTSLFFL